MMLCLFFLWKVNIPVTHVTPVTIIVINLINLIYNSHLMYSLHGKLKGVTYLLQPVTTCYNLLQIKKNLLSRRHLSCWYGLNHWLWLNCGKHIVFSSIYPSWDATRNEDVQWMVEAGGHLDVCISVELLTVCKCKLHLCTLGNNRVVTAVF